MSILQTVTRKCASRASSVWHLPATRTALACMLSLPRSLSSAPSMKPVPPIPAPQPTNLKSQSQNVSLGKHAWNLGAGRFLFRTYSTTAFGILSGLVVAREIGMTALALQYPFALVLGGCLAAFGSHLFLNTRKSPVVQKEVGFLQMPQPMSHNLAYAFQSIGTGMLLASSTTLAKSCSPSSAIGTCVFLMALASVYAFIRRSDALKQWERPVMSGFYSTIGALALSALTTYFCATHALPQFFMNLSYYGGIMIFSAMTAFDTFQSVEMYKNRTPDHIKCASRLHFNFINIMGRMPPF